jgi:hypothetical protein
MAKLFGGIMFMARVLTLCETVSASVFEKAYPFRLVDPEKRLKFLGELLEAHTDSSEAVVLELPLPGKPKSEDWDEEARTFPIRLEPLRVGHMYYGSPGKIVLFGASGILKEIRKFYEFRTVLDGRKRMDKAAADLEEEKVKKMKLENFQRSIEVLRKLGFSVEEVKEILKNADNWAKVYFNYHAEEKIKKIEVRTDDEEEPPEVVTPG